MPTLNIEGRKVTVDDSFLKLSPDDQNATVEEIAKSLGGAQPEKAAAAPPPPADAAPANEGGILNQAAGLAKAAGAGVAKGALGAAGFIPWLSDNLHGAANSYLFDPLFEKISGPRKAGPEPVNINALASPESLIKGVESVTGEFHKPQNRAERYVETIGSFLPTAVAGPGSIGTKLVMQALVPGAASEAAGQATEGTRLEPWARFGAAVVAPFAAGGGVRAVRKLYEPAMGVNGYGANHLVRAMKADTPEVIEANLGKLGPEATLADAGEAMLGKAQGASLNSDEGRSILFKAFRKRDEGTNARIASDVDDALGKVDRDPVQLTRDIVDYRSKVDSHNYPAVLREAPPVKIAPVLTAVDEAIMSAANGGAEQKALVNLKNMLTRDSTQPRISPWTGKQEINARGQPAFETVKVSQNRAGVLHKVKGELDNVIEHELPGLGVQAGALRNQQASLKQFRYQLNQALEHQVPGYARANRVSERLAKRAEAVEASSNYLGGGKTTPSPQRFLDEHELRDAGERIAFAMGSRGHIDRVIGTQGNDLAALRRELQGEGGWNTAKLAIAHGEEPIRQIVDSVARNTKFRDTFGKISEGAQTEIRRAAREQMKPAGFNESAMIQPGANVTGLALTGLKKGAVAIADALTLGWQSAGREGVAKVLSAQGPQRDEYVRQIRDALGRYRVAADAAGSAGRRAAVAGLAEVLGRLAEPSDRRPR